MSPTPVIAIFDIGKTNKKFFLFDEQYRIVLERTVQFEEICDEDGFVCEDLFQISRWIRRTIAEIIDCSEFEVQACNFSAYGASLVHIDEKGNPVTPLYNYLKPYPKSLQEKLYEAYGGEDVVALATASPVLGNLNSGMQLIRIKYGSVALYNRIHISLHLPQYISYLLTGKLYSEITSIGCHTALWDFSKNAYHDWVVKENIISKLPPIHETDEVIEITVNGKWIKSGLGLHDSSAALVPYLLRFKEPFILLSTGTWSISLNPFNREPLTAGELRQDCLSYISFEGHPVKASRLFAGNEHEQEVKRLADYFSVDTHYYKQVVFNKSLLKEMVSETETGSVEVGLPSSGFSKRELGQFSNYEEAYHRLVLDIMRQQKLSTSLVMGREKVSRIFVDGGFANNSVYMSLLAAAFPGKKVYASFVSQASAIGAALVIHGHWNRQGVPDNLVQLVRYH
ncbi:MAG: FGGY family carbohydrate kinase [Sediminibacterium sp.]|nr:FGGY family carbohydrate kinase [Sediminibacterium sp.]MDP3126913.1 FGGY family carbohydrate kinase [Sediminibacterium sp.]